MTDHRTWVPPGEDLHEFRILPSIRSSFESLSEAQSRIAKYVLDNPDKVVRGSLGELAAAIKTGEASLVRFCQQLGYKGVRDFKIALASEIATLRRRSDGVGVQQGIAAGLADRMIHALDESVSSVVTADFEAHARRLRASRRIDIFGAGVSGLVAQFAAYRLMRVGLIAQAFQDATLVHEVMGGLDPDCIAIGVSESGLTEDTIRFLQGAKAAGAFCMALTGRPTSPLARIADAVLFACPVDPRPVGGEIVAAPAKLLLVETLAATVAALTR